MADAPFADAPFRLAIRHEGKMVNAYLAKTETMEGATLLGSLVLSLASNPETFEQWKQFMKDAFAVAIKEALGATVTHMDEQPAPEHERSGHG